MKKLTKKQFNQTININNLREIYEILSDHYGVFAYATFSKSGRNIKNKKIQYYNLLSTCIIRIKETSSYVSNYTFKQCNTCGQAFDFYEFINCSSIIFNCVESLLNIFGLEMKNYFSVKKYFSKSNKTKTSDFKFFKFIRSAAVAHPDNTTAYKKIVKRNNEIYPYAVWKDSVLDLFLTGADVESDITLLSWAASQKSKYKRYYLYIDEFYDFIRAVVDSVSNVIPIMQRQVIDYKNKHKCFRLKDPKDFDDYSSYLDYLSNRIKKLTLNKKDYPDGGLLLAAHIINNKIIKQPFKRYIMERIAVLRNMMINNFDEIGYDTIFDELDLYHLIEKEVDDAGYVDEKFNSYLRMEARREIKYNYQTRFIPDLIKYKNNPEDGSDAFWAVYKLFSCKAFLTVFKTIKDIEKLTYADIYEISLEIIFERLTINNGRR